MHLWIAATIAFCCVIIAEAQANRPPMVGDLRPIKSMKRIKDLAAKAVVKINEVYGKESELVLVTVLDAKSQMIAGRKAVLILVVGPVWCNDRPKSADCVLKQRTCNASIVKELKKPEEVKVNCDPVA